MSWKLLLAVIVSLAVGFGALSWLDRDATGGVPAADSAPPPVFDRSLPLEERLRALESAVSEERNARQLLQDELQYVTSALEEMNDRSPAPEVADTVAAAATRNDDPRSYNRRRDPVDRATQLEQAGFTPSQAQSIAQREAELQMAALQARYEAGQSGDMGSVYRSRGAVDDALRQELGDEDYERYRAANGRSVNVTVNSVIDSSPASRAGLQPGDHIVRYGGERVFSLSDLTRQTLQGEPGQQVVVDIMRDGTPMQVVILRGPLGISGGGSY